MSVESTKGRSEIVIIGAGAAGLMATIWAARSHPQASITVLDGARKLGAKILVAGGGRCNVTHDVVTADAYAGSSRNAIRKVLQRFDVAPTIAFFHQLGVELKREETGKLFPVSDDAHTVLNALLTAARLPNVHFVYPCRVEQISKCTDHFVLSGAWGERRAANVILATGGKSLPKSGSDGGGYALAQALGHTITARVFPALVPLTLSADHFLCALSGIANPATFSVQLANGKIVAAFTDAALCTHFGLSGPAVLDISRYWLDARLDNEGAQLLVNWWPGKTSEQFDQELQGLGATSPLKLLRQQLPERLARALCEQAAVDPVAPGHQITRERRKALVRLVTALALPVTGNRGWNVAEVTAGGVPLAEIDLKTMQSRICPGLYFCGEICDVDGRIGGYNFQWAWASGYVAGTSLKSFATDERR